MEFVETRVAILDTEIASLTQKVEAAREAWADQNRANYKEVWQQLTKEKEALVAERKTLVAQHSAQGVRTLLQLSIAQCLPQHTVRVTRMYTCLPQALSC